MSYKRQYIITNKIQVVTFYLIKVLGLWPYKFQVAKYQIEYSFFMIIYSVVVPSLMLYGYVAVGSDIYSGAGETAVPPSKMFASVPLQLVVILYSYLVIISYLLMYVGQHLNYERRKCSFSICKKVADCMKEYQEFLDTSTYITKFLLKTLVYDFFNFFIFFYNMTWASNQIHTKPYLAIVIYLPIFAMRLNTNVFYGGILLFNIFFKQINISLNRIFCRSNESEFAQGKLYNLNNQLEKVYVLYFELIQGTKAFNSVFSFQILIWFTVQLIVLITQTFYQYVAVVQLIKKNESYFVRQNVSILLAIFMSTYELLSTASACNSLVKEVNYLFMSYKFCDADDLNYFSNLVQANNTAVILHTINSNLNVDLSLKNVSIFLDSKSSKVLKNK